ncbi:MAG: Mth938-like domain-containing protein [Candidatus Thiodiazotropha sp.]
MKFVLDTSGDGYAIQRYDTGEIIIDQRRYRQSLILLPDQVIDDWSPASVAELAMADFEQLAALGPEIVLLGTGREQQFPHPSLSLPLMEQRIGFEVMDTAAACRTYNILMTEGRRVAAALFMI